MFRHHRGTDTMEWVVVTVIVLGVVGTAILLLSNALGGRLAGMDAELGQPPAPGGS